MATDLSVGDQVFVPTSRLDLGDQYPFAIKEFTVTAVSGRSIRVDMPGGEQSKLIGASVVHSNVGILILNIGDFETETTLLDPLAKSILQYCRMLVSDDQVRVFKIRSLAELRAIWQREQAAYSHVIICGHGTSDSLKFGVDSLVAVEDFLSTLRVYGAPEKIFISLCCSTGYKSFGGEVSRKAICTAFIAPLHTVHGAIASQFCQTFLAHHFLEGVRPAVAFSRSRESVPGATSFRLWQGGRIWRSNDPRVTASA